MADKRWRFYCCKDQHGAWYIRAKGKVGPYRDVPVVIPNEAGTALEVAMFPKMTRSAARAAVRVLNGEAR